MRSPWVHVGRLSAVAVTIGGAGLLAMPLAQASTKVYVYTGAEQTFVVPSGVRSLHLEAIGAPGGAAFATPTTGPGGLGARVDADLAVTAGETLYIEVGGVGTPGAGASGPLNAFNGGGAGGISSDVNGGGGGGATDVRTRASSAAGSLSTRVVVAGGGGGGGFNAQNGGAAGKAGQPTCSGCGGGRAGGSSAAGAGGSGDVAGDPGTHGTGGAGGESALGDGGGGGGGGLYGGGGGAGSDSIDNGAGGGGGSSGFGAGTSAKSVHADTTGSPRLTITYTKSEKTTTTATVGHKHKTLSVSGTVKPAAGGVAVKVALLRKSHGKYRTVSTKHPLMSRSGHYSTSFSRPKPGKCEVVAAFAGFHSLEPSKVTKKTTC